MTVFKHYSSFHLKLKSCHGFNLCFPLRLDLWQSIACWIVFLQLHKHLIILCLQCLIVWSQIRGYSFSVYLMWTILLPLIVLFHSSERPPSFCCCAQTTQLYKLKSNHRAEHATVALFRTCECVCSRYSRCPTKPLCGYERLIFKFIECKLKLWIIFSISPGFKVKHLFQREGLHTRLQGYHFTLLTQCLPAEKKQKRELGCYKQTLVSLRL